MSACYQDAVIAAAERGYVYVVDARISPQVSPAGSGRGGDGKSRR
jgi:hypothetical protein